MLFANRRQLCETFEPPVGRRHPTNYANSLEHFPYRSSLFLEGIPCAMAGWSIHWDIPSGIPNGMTILKHSIHLIGAVISRLFWWCNMVNICQTRHDVNILAFLANCHLRKYPTLFISGMGTEGHWSFDPWPDRAPARTCRNQWSLNSLLCPVPFPFWFCCLWLFHGVCSPLRIYLSIYLPVHILYTSLSLSLYAKQCNAMRYNAVQCNVMECHAYNIHNIVSYFSSRGPQRRDEIFRLWHGPSVRSLVQMERFGTLGLSRFLGDLWCGRT